MNPITNELPFIPTELWNIIYDFKEALEIEENRRKSLPIMNELKKINDMVLDIDEFNWGLHTEEEADNRFNSEVEDDEWGTKSSGILYWISCLNESEEEEE